MLMNPKFYHGSTDGTVDIMKNSIEYLCSYLLKCLGLIALHLAKNAFNVSPKDAMPKLRTVFEDMYRYVCSKPDEEVVKGIQPLPGVLETLRTLAQNYSETTIRALVTGNLEGAARIKMRACGVLGTQCLHPPAASQSWEGAEEYAFLGGFGSDYCSGDIEDLTRIYKDRAEQIVIAYERAKTLLKPGQHIARVIHVGDAPNDVLAAKECFENKRFGEDVTVGCIGVVTGHFQKDELVAQVGAAIPGRWEPLILEKGFNDPQFLQHAVRGIYQDTDA